MDHKAPKAHGNDLSTKAYAVWVSEVCMYVFVCVRACVVVVVVYCAAPRGANRSWHSPLGGGPVCCTASSDRVPVCCTRKGACG